MDGGDHWTEITEGIPVIQCRDLAVQEREDDLVDDLVDLVTERDIRLLGLMHVGGDGWLKRRGIG